MPTTPIITFSNKKLEPAINPQGAEKTVVRLGASLTLARGTVLGEVSATPGIFGAYSDAAVDGRQVARGILMYDVKTDANGLITFGDVSTGGEHGQKSLSVGMYTSGYFRAEDLTGLDANGLADLQGNLVYGDISTGLIRF